MDACFIDVAAELVRSTLTGATQSQFGNENALTVALHECATGTNRARGVPVYNPVVTLSWGYDVWSSGVHLVDKRGYLVEWQIDDVRPWLVSALSGARCRVVIDVVNASAVPKQWTDKRKAAAALRVSRLDAEAIRTAADNKIAGVAGWAESQRKTDVVTAAGRMLGAAVWIDAAGRIAGGNDLFMWGGGGDGGAV